jgi:putative addiction module component (TIGR02574 family)
MITGDMPSVSKGDFSMSATLKSLGIEHLSVAEKILLVEEIWDSIAAEADVLPLTEAQKEDLARRVAAYEANRHAGSAWEEVKARLREKP